MMLLLALLICGASAGAPRNITMIGLRPSFMPPSDMGNKDWADAAGDLFFWLGDQTANQAYCKDHPHEMLCSCEVTCQDNVYTQVVLTLVHGNDSLNTVEDKPDPSTNGYAPCNPSGSKDNYTYHCDDGDKLKVGQARVATRYNQPRCDKDYCKWKFKASKLVGGLWWSVPKGGDCGAAGADPSKCTWRYAATVKVINGSCANDKVKDVVVAKGDKACYAACPSGGSTAALECFNKCFFATVFGDGNKPGMSREELVAPFQKAFDSDDPKEGGCVPRILPSVEAGPTSIVV